MLCATTHSTFLQHNKGTWQNKCAPLVCTGSNISTWWNRSWLLNWTRLEHSEQFYFCRNEEELCQMYNASSERQFCFVGSARRGSRHVLTTAWQPETTIAVKWLTNRLRPVHCRVLWQNGIIMYKRLSGHIIASLVTTRNWSAGQKLCKRALSFKKKNTSTWR